MRQSRQLEKVPHHRIQWAGMYLSSIEIHGFKSFAEKTRLVFDGGKSDDKGITAVVGPNGSGKSNIADAVRWVLGEQSMKNLRGKKSEDVVFAGSSKKSRMGFAEVTLTFNNHDKEFPLDFADVVIGRRLFRDGTSEYLLQNEKIKLFDLQLLLAKAGIGSRSYTVIGQGMIDAILLATPSERRDFFDEAAGVKELELKKRQTELKLQSSRDHVQSAQLIQGELEPRVRYLAKVVARAQEKTKLEIEYHEKGTRYFGAALFEVEDNLQRTKGVADEKKMAVQQAQQAYDAVVTQATQPTQQAHNNEALVKIQQVYHGARAAYERATERVFAAQQAWELEKNKRVLAAQVSLLDPQELEKLVAPLLLEVEAALASTATTPEMLKTLLRKTQTTLKNIEHTYQKTVVTDTTGEESKLRDAVSVAQTEKDKARAEVSTVEQQLQEISREQTTQPLKNDVQLRLSESLKNLQAAERLLQEQEIILARLMTRKELLQQEMMRDFGKSVAANKSDAAIETLRNEFYAVKRNLESIGIIDDSVFTEYTEANTRLQEISLQLTDIVQTITSLEGGLQELVKAMKERRDVLFKNLDIEFMNYFSQLFGGGAAGIEPVYVKQTEEGEVLSEEIQGIEISAQPPGKRIKDIAVLSGGERALTSVALICAILKINPSPFVVLDEVDAALDESNALRYAEILESLAHNTQFIVVTHNRATMTKSKLLYGVTMGEDGVSQLLSVELEKAVHYAK